MSPSSFGIAFVGGISIGLGQLWLRGSAVTNTHYLAGICAVVIGLVLFVVSIVVNKRAADAKRKSDR